MPLSNLSDLPSFRREWDVLLRVRLLHGFDARRLAELARSADWSQLLVLAEEHSVLGHLAVRLRGLEENLVPDEIMQILMEHITIRFFLSTLGMTAELFRLLELFAVNGIPALIVKGPALAMQAYGDPTMRSYGDISTFLSASEISAGPRNRCGPRVSRKPFSSVPSTLAKFPASTLSPRPTRS